MRLIDVDALFAELNEKRIPSNRIINDIIMEQPTAYDVDKVVEQLEDRSTLSRPVGWGRSHVIITLDEAIEIVKGGVYGDD